MPQNALSPGTNIRRAISRAEENGDCRTSERGGATAASSAAIARAERMAEVDESLRRDAERVAREGERGARVARRRRRTTATPATPS